MRITSIVAALVLLVSMVAYSDDDQKIYSLGEFSLESGQILSDAKLSYTTHGQLNEDGTNVILLPSFYLGDHHGYDFLIGTDKALKPSEYFIVAVDMFQNGLSSSPSNTPPPADGINFPSIAIRDNIKAQKRLLEDEFGVTELKAVIGFSMGAQQAFQWGVSYPDGVEKLVPICEIGRAHV